MATLLGRKKRDATVISRHEQNEEEQEHQQQNEAPSTAAEEYREMMRKAFEAQFAPIDPDLLKPIGSRSDSEDSDVEMSEDDDEEEEEEEGEGDENEDWSGLSGEESEGEKVAVVDHSRTGKRPDDLDLPDKSTRKRFMNAKPPPLEDPKPKPQTYKKTPEEESTDAMNLKHDLSLQRLLKESHLLESSSDLDPTGANRHKAFDLRMQSLGAKSSLFQQEKMPMSHRKGIISKATRKEDIRRREARENGIILEKPLKQKSKAARRERGVGGPGVGKFAGGTLRLSQRDVSAITGPKRSAVGKKKGGKRGRR